MPIRIIKREENEKKRTDKLTIKYSTLSQPQKLTQPPI
jgi:hypothetical protein